LQEEVTQKTIALYVKVGKGAARLTEQALQKAIQKFLEQKSKPAHGKQTMRQLMKQNAGVSNIEITDSNIKAFESTAKKYNIDFSLKKVKGEQTRYLVFFKGRDADVMTAAFQEFSAKKLNREKKPSIRKALAAAKDKAKQLMAADKGKIMMEDGKNYGDFLLETINAAKDQFSADELKLLQGEAEKIRDIGNKLAALEETYPEIVQKSLDSDMNMPTDKDMDTMPDSGNKDNKTDSGSTDNKTDSGNTGNKTDSGSTGSKTDDSSLPKFPAFEGKDLDGNTVKSSDLFSGKAVTVVNFWFTTCGPCVGELGDLDALNKELSGKGGALIGINAFTLDGNEAAISDAKDVLTQSGATYQNVYFDSGSEAGKFVESIYAYPTTYVVNRSGRIVGDPIVGAITSKAQADALQAQIDKALAADMG